MRAKNGVGLSGLKRVNNPFQDGLNGLTPYRVNPYPVVQAAVGLETEFNPSRAA